MTNRNRNKAKKGELKKDNGQPLCTNGGQNGSPSTKECDTTHNKRKRRSTGGTFDVINNNAATITKDQFKQLSTDDKLVTIFDMINSVQSLSLRVEAVEQRINDIESSTKCSFNRLKVLEYKSIDQEARARRNNLIFRDIPEMSINENCENVLSTFIEDYLDIDTSQIYVQAVHRIGAPRRDKIRPIIANFIDRKDTECILEHAYKLKGTEYGINRDYPNEIVAARSRLWPKYKELKAKYRKSAVFIGYPAKLIVNKRVVRDEFPDWNEIIRQSRIPEENTPNTPNPVEESVINGITTDNPFDVLMEESRSEAESEDESSVEDTNCPYPTKSKSAPDSYSQDMMKTQAIRSARSLTLNSYQETPTNLSKSDSKANTDNQNRRKTTKESSILPSRIDSGASGGSKITSLPSQ